MYKAAILTISDKCFAKEREDATGPAISTELEKCGYQVVYQNIVPDERELIEKEIINLCDQIEPNVVFTNGGTGFSERDVTPEATLSVCERLIPGFAEACRQRSLEITPKAMLSRAVSGIRKKTIIINLPGSPKGALENLCVVLKALGHGIDILTGKANECAEKPKQT